MSLNVKYLLSFCCAILVVYSSILAAEAIGKTGSVTRGVLISSLPGKPSFNDKILNQGDIVISWKRAADKTNKTRSARGKIRTVYDWHDLVKNQVTQGSVNLKIIRDGKKTKRVLPEGEWKGSVSPVFSQEIHDQFQQGMNLLASEKQKAEELITDLAEKLMAQKHGNAAAWILHQAALSVNKSRDLETSRRFFDKAMKKAERTRSNKAGLFITLDLADILFRTRKFSEADALYEKALGLSQKVSESELTRVFILRQRGKILWSQGKIKAARPFFEQAVRLAELTAPKSIDCARTRQNLGTLLQRIGETNTATNYFKQAEKTFKQKMPGTIDYARTLNGLGVLFNQQGDLMEARKYFEQTLVLFRKLSPESFTESIVLSNLANIEVSEGNLEKAEPLYKRAVALFRKYYPSNLQFVSLLHNYGRLKFTLGKLEEASDIFDEASGIVKKLAPDSMEMAANLMHSGIIHRVQGDLEGSQKLLGQAFSIIKHVAPASPDAAVILRNLAKIFQVRGEIQQAREYLGKALTIYDKIAPDSVYSTIVHGDLGFNAIQDHDYKQARVHLTKNIDMMEKILPESLDMVAALQGMADLNKRLENPEKQKQFLNRALHICEKIAPRSLAHASMRSEMGRFFLQHDQPDQAYPHLERAHDLFKSFDLQGLEFAKLLFLTGLYYKQTEKYEDAYVYFKKAVEQLEIVRVMLGGGEKAEEFFSWRFEIYYKELIEIQVHLGKNDEAFRFLENYRGKVLLALLATRHLDFSRDLSPELQAEWSGISTQMARLFDQLPSLDLDSDQEKITLIRKKLYELQARDLNLREQVRLESPRMAGIHYPEPMDADQARRFLSDDTVFLSYCFTLDSMIIFVLSADGLEVVTRPVDVSRLKADVSFMAMLLGSPDLELKTLLNTSFRLYSQLIKPVEAKIRPAKHLLICPDGPLHYLPFAALSPDGKKYIIHDKSISRLLSMSVYNQIRGLKKETEKTVAFAAFGDPVYREPADDMALRSTVGRVLRDMSITRLPATREEVKTIAALYGNESRLFLGEDAREEAVRDLGPHISRIHFSCHGYFDDQLPLNSGLILTIPDKAHDFSDDGILQAWEIFESLRIDADLVTMSACETGLGKFMAGEGLIGLNRAFIFAGAQSILSSFWQVADQSTAELMKRFYSNRKNGQTKASALRKAQMDFVSGKVDLPGSKANSKDTTHPFYWAPFVLQGDWL